MMFELSQEAGDHAANMVRNGLGVRAAVQAAIGMEIRAGRLAEVVAPTVPEVVAPATVTPPAVLFQVDPAPIEVRYEGVQADDVRLDL